MTALPDLRRAPMNYGALFDYHWSALENPIPPTPEQIDHLSRCMRSAEAIAEGLQDQPDAHAYRDDCIDIRGALDGLLAQTHGRGRPTSSFAHSQQNLQVLQRIEQKVQRVENEQNKLINKKRLSYRPFRAVLLPVRDPVRSALPPLTACLEHYNFPPPDPSLPDEQTLGTAADTILAHITGKN